MAGEDGRRRLFAAGVPDALRAAADLLAEAATARSGPYSGASPEALAKVVAGVEPFPEEGAGLDAALAGLGRLSLRHGVDPGHPACANGCAAALLEQARAAALPPARVAPLLDQLLTTPGRSLPAPALLQVGPADDPRLVRRRATCCLNYTVAGQPCATCPLLPPAETRRRLAAGAAPAGG